MLFKSKKKKRPIDVFSNIRKPHLEEAYVKFPGRKLRRASKKRRKDSVGMNWDLPHKLRKKYGSRYTVIHTHPSGDGTPTSNDIVTFLAHDEIKTSIIVPLKENNQPAGYFVMKKNKNFKFPEDDIEDFADSIGRYHQDILSSDSYQKSVLSLKKLTKKYDFGYRFFFAEGEELSEEARGFKSSRKPLESKLVTVSFTFISLSILTSLSTITGNVISDSSRNISSGTSIGLFIAGLCFAGLIFFFGRSPK